MSTEDWQRHGPNLADALYGQTPPQLEDPAEGFFEASKLNRRTLAYDAPGTARLAGSPWLLEATARATKHFPHRPATALPAPEWPALALGDALRRRRSAAGFVAGGLSAVELSTLLHGAYGVTGRLGDHALYTSPSAGGLHPLDLYVVLEAVDGLPDGTHHFDPVAGCLRHLADGRRQAFAAAALQDDELDPCPALLVIAGSFWRSRFKYGQRGLRFVLLEAGHVAQNLSLVATAIGVASRLYGGFLDDEMSDLLDLDGVNEAPLYLVALGRAAPAP
jgi:SagB-type dehydrogenase family enzyme